MASQNNIYPLFFILERVRNGYILTAKEETGGLKEAEFRKEVVSIGSTIKYKKENSR